MAVRYSSVEVVTTMSTRGRPRGRRGLLRLSLTSIAAGWLLLASSVHAAGPEVVVLPTTGIVDDSMAKYLADNIAIAEQRGAAAVVIKLNTPGGALTSTNDIVGTLLESKVPIIVWVAPAGGFAASAGTFITLASNIALMAPGTRIGAASPINGDGTDIGGTLGTKIMNDAIAEITSIAQERGRNVDWAVSAVREWDARIAASAGPDAVWLACSHGDIIKAILADALGLHLDLFQRIVVDPCSVSVVRYTDTRPFVLRVNDTGGDVAALLPPKRRRRRKPAADAAVGGGAGPG